MKYLIIISVSFIMALYIISCNSNTSTVYSDADTNQVVEEAVINFEEGIGTASVTRNFYFLFDGSGSMAEECASETKIDGAKMAISKYLDKVPDDVNLGLLVFGTDNSEGITELVPLGPGNRENFKKAISEVNPSSGTPLGAATNYGVDQLIKQYKNQLGYGEYRLIVVTDGISTDPDVFQIALQNTLRYPFIGIYGIGLCINENHLLKSYSLNYTDAHDYQQLSSALEKTLAETENFDVTEFTVSDSIQ